MVGRVGLELGRHGPARCPPGRQGSPRGCLSTARAWRLGTVIVPQGWSGPGVLQAARRAALLAGWDEGRGCCSESPKTQASGRCEATGG